MRPCEAAGEGAILYIDLDDFNHINDGLGHHVGDLLLQNVADALGHMDGVAGHCYRLGGDEFAVIVTTRHIEQRDAMIRNIQNLFSRPWLLQGTEYYCTMSMGVVCIPKDGIDLSLLLQRADIAAHWAKVRERTVSSITTTTSAPVLWSVWIWKNACVRR